MVSAVTNLSLLYFVCPAQPHTLLSAPLAFILRINTYIMSNVKSTVQIWGKDRRGSDFFWNGYRD